MPGNSPYHIHRHIAYETYLNFKKVQYCLLLQLHGESSVFISSETTPSYLFICGEPYAFVSAGVKSPTETNASGGWQAHK